MIYYHYITVIFVFLQVHVTCGQYNSIIAVLLLCDIICFVGCKVYNHNVDERKRTVFGLEELRLLQTDRGMQGFCWGSEVPSGHIITLHQAHSSSLHPPAQNKLNSLNPFLSTQCPPRVWTPLNATACVSHNASQSGSKTEQVRAFSVMARNYMFFLNDENNKLNVGRNNRYRTLGAHRVCWCFGMTLDSWDPKTGSWNDEMSKVVNYPWYMQYW